MPNAGQRVRALDFPAAVSDHQDTTGTSTSTTYTSTLTGGTTCGVAFTAPMSGRVHVLNTTSLFNSGANFTRMSYIVRTGSSIGAGTTFQSSSDANCVLHIGTSEERQTISSYISGLTPGNSYNIQQTFRVSAGTGTWQGKELTVVPLP